MSNWLETISGSKHHLGKRLEGGGHALRAGGEMLLTGAALGALKAKGHLDLGAKKNVPVDGLVAAVGLVGGTMMAHTEFGHDLRNMGAAALAVFAFRKSDEFVAKKYPGPIGGAIGAGAPAGALGAGTPAAHGEFGADPLVAAARYL